MEHATCREDGCERPVKVRKYQLCSAHYQRLRRLGSLKSGGPGMISDSHGNAVLTEDQARQIRARYNSTKHLSQRHPDRPSIRDLAAEFGVHAGTIFSVVQGRTWKHLL